MDHIHLESEKSDNHFAAKDHVQDLNKKNPHLKEGAFELGHKNENLSLKNPKSHFPQSFKDEPASPETKEDHSKCAKKPRKRLIINLIQSSDIDSMTNKYHKAHTVYTIQHKKYNDSSLSPFSFSFDYSSSYSDHSARSADSSHKNQENKLSFSCMANGAASRKIPARYAPVVEMNKNKKNDHCLIFPPLQLKSDLKLLIENSFGNMKREIMLEKKYRDINDQPLVPTISKRAGEGSWRWSAPAYEEDEAINNQ
ncbi:hypothetical protein SteCoe_37205 [Stentor coeruleus]|uniref:Uncharacterized protein n=1 Tax=Stentor coeruleus TaxID=5963 RepID=A0A1R2ANU4_9CILI|nr:hypothetical protein SteCoe_37205 [Stentor coeruleus]